VCKTRQEEERLTTGRVKCVSQAWYKNFTVMCTLMCLCVYESTYVCGRLGTIDR
jgi:hypothetical protein